MSLPRKEKVWGCFSRVEGPGGVIRMNHHHRANDEASLASEQPPRTFGFAMGSGAVFVPQVEVFVIWEDHWVSEQTPFC